MNKKQKIIVSIVGITIVLLALLGITYAYYLTRIQGNTNTNSISITTADLKLEYGDGNGLLTATNITPGKQVEFKTTGNNTTTEKTFTVTNSGNSTIEGYAVSLDYAYIADTMPSIFERPEDFQITLTCSSNKVGGSCNGFTGNFNNESIMLTSNDIEQNEVHTYSLSIYYNDPSLDQSNDMGKNLNLKVQIYNISETTDIEGTITGVDSTHSVRIESEPKMSTIVNGKYNFKGVEIGTHTLTVLDKDGNEIDKEYIVVKSGTTPAITTTKVTIDNTEVDAIGITITKEERIAKLSTKVEGGILSFESNTSSTGVFNPYSNNTNSLAYQIINNAIVAKNNNSTAETKFSSIPLTPPGIESSGINEKTLSITQDDYGNSYYYRGSVQDNYVNYSGMCWRIVRILGNGDIKLILADRDNECDSEYFYISNNDSAFISDYNCGYGTEVNGIGIYGINYSDSYIPIVLNSWLNGGNYSYFNMKHYYGTASLEEDIVFTDTFTKKINTNQLSEIEWCNDNTFIFDDENEGDNPNHFGPSHRLYSSESAVTLKCNMVNYEGTSALKYSSKIGLLTSDEIAFAGHSTSYLVQNATGLDWLTMSAYNSADFISVNSGVMSSSNKGGMPGSSIRPSIVLKNNLNATGNGTRSNPYVIE